MISSRSHFKGLISIPNVEDTAPNSNLLGNVSEIQLFIEEYEREVLTKSLGYALNKEFQSYLEVAQNATVHTIKTDAPQKWKDLFSGKEYSLNGRTVNWRGITFKDGSLDRSLIAYYVFFFFLKSDLARYYGTGIQTENSKNSTKADPAPKALDAWRKFYELTVEGDTDERSMFQFIQDMNDLDESTYQKWKPYSFGKLNFASI